MNQKIDKPTTLKTLAFYVGGIAGFLIGYYVGFIVVLLFFGSFLIGSWFAKWYAKKEKINLSLINFIIWSNLITWLIPFLGILTGTIAIKFSDELKSKFNTKKYKILGVIGIVISLANFILSIYIQTHTQSGNSKNKFVLIENDKDHDIYVTDKTSEKVPADLIYLGKPIDSLCFYNEERTTLINLNDCGIKKEKYMATGQDNDLIKNGYIGFNWKDTNASFSLKGYSYYKFFPASDNSYWVYTMNNGGGSGDFTAINLMQRKNEDTIEVNTIDSGDRCNGGIQDVKKEGDHLIFSANLTASDFLAIINQNPHHLKAYDDLAACAICCTGKAFYDVIPNSLPKLNYIDLGTTNNIEEMPSQGKYQSCFNKLIARYVSSGKNKLNEFQLKTLITEFNEKCVK